MDFLLSSVRAGVLLLMVEDHPKDGLPRQLLKCFRRIALTTQLMI